MNACSNCGESEPDLEVRMIGEGAQDDGSWKQWFLCMFCEMRALSMWAKFGRYLEPYIGSDEWMEIRRKEKEAEGVEVP